MNKIVIILYILFFTFIVSCSRSEYINVKISNYPDGKDFAFTIIDDPDYGNFKQKYIIYEFLDSLNFKTTKGIWVLDNRHGSGIAGWATNTRGVTATNKEYLEYNKYLKKRGFEICLHTVSPGNDLREETRKGYELFKRYFGEDPVINTNHAENLENIYWGSDRFSNSLLKFLYRFKREHSEGHIETSEYFWGDICKEKTKYVRGFATDKINTFSVNPSMPYHVTDKPYVNYWYGCTDGYDCKKFKQVVSDSNIDRLLSERGVSIVYTHFAFGFLDNNFNIDETVKKQLYKISKMNGWFVPASTILDRLLLLRNVNLFINKNDILIVNKNDVAVNGLTIITNHKKLFNFNTKTWYFPNSEGEIIIGDIYPYGAVKLSTNDNIEKTGLTNNLEKLRIVWDWFVGRFNK